MGDFLEFFHSEHPELEGDFGVPGEFMHETHKRFFNTTAKYIDLHVNKLKEFLDGQVAI